MMPSEPRLTTTSLTASCLLRLIHRTRLLIKRPAASESPSITAVPPRPQRCVRTLVTVCLQPHLQSCSLSLPVLFSPFFNLMLLLRHRLSCPAPSSETLVRSALDQSNPNFDSPTLSLASLTSPHLHSSGVDIPCRDRRAKSYFPLSRIHRASTPIWRSSIAKPHTPP